MTLQPRTVAPGYARRWSLQALALVGRTLHWHVALALGFTLCFALLPWARLLDIPLGLFMYFTFAELAARADQRVVTAQDMLEMLQQAGARAVQHTWDKRVVVVICTAMSAVFALAPLASKAGTPLDLGRLGTWLFDARSPLAFAGSALAMGAVFQGYRSSIRLLMTHYCLQRWSGASGSLVDFAREQAAAKNTSAATFLELSHYGGLLLLVHALPLLTPALLCFLPALSYVAFREMFVDGEGNQTPRRQRARALSLGSAA